MLNCFLGLSSYVTDNTTKTMPKVNGNCYCLSFWITLESGRP